MMLNTPKDKHIIIARVDNKPGVVSRMSGLFTRRLLKRPLCWERLKVEGKGENRG